MTHDASPSFGLTPDIRVGSLTDLVEAVPYLVGFHPSRSLVVLGRAPDDPRLRTVVSGPLDDVEALPELITRLASDGVGRIFAIGYGPSGAGEAPDPHRVLVDLLAEACAPRGVTLDDVLYVHDERLWSLVCTNPVCCPAQGRAVCPPGTSAVAAAAAFAGLPTIPSRAELREALICKDGQAVPADRLRQAADGYVRAIAVGNVERWRRARCREWDRELSPVDGADPPSPSRLARLAQSTFDLHIRDHLCSWAADERRGPGLAAVRRLLAVTPTGFAVPLLTAAAWLAWSAGDRPLAHRAAELALDEDPDYSFARIILQGLRSGLRGDEIRMIAGGLSRPPRPGTPSSPAVGGEATAGEAGSGDEESGGVDDAPECGPSREGTPGG